MRRPRNIKIFGPDAVVINWLVLITLGMVSLTGSILLKEFIFEELDIYGGIFNYIPHFDWLIDAHKYFGLALLAVGALHIILNLNNKEKEILPKNPVREIKGIIHTFMYILFLAKRDEMGSHGKYKGHQRLSYVMLAYMLGTIGFSIVLMQIEYVHEAAFLIHLVLGVHLLLLVIYRAILHLRKKDKVQLKAYYLTGKLPEWYVRKYHYLWYRQLIGRAVVDENLPEKDKKKDGKKDEDPTGEVEEKEVAEKPVEVTEPAKEEIEVPKEVSA